MKGIKHAKWIDKFDVAKILDLDSQGKTINEISRVIEIPTRRLGEMLKLNNIVIKKRGELISKNHDFFEVIDSEIKAYLLGYTIADGSVIIEPKKREGEIYSYSKRLCYQVSVDDREVIDLLKQYIAPDALTKEYHNPKGAKVRKRQLCLRFSSVKLVDDLIKLKVKPNKSFTGDFVFDFDKIEYSLIRHLIRGFFDGNGFYRKNTLSFSCTSPQFLEQIIEYFKIEIPGITYRLRRSEGIRIACYDLCFNTGNDVYKKVYNLLYNDSNYFLTRKITKFNMENTVLTNQITQG